MGAVPTTFRALMYHAVLGPGDQVPAGREDGAELYDLPLASFEAQMAALAATRVTVIAPDREPLPTDRSVVLTFDDGERSSHDRALPVLVRHGFRAWFFVTPRRVGTPGYMSWSEIRALVDAGMSIGAHGLTHQMMVGLPPETLRDELDGAKAEIEDAIGKRVLAVSIPRGFYDQRVIDRAVAAGYQRVYVSKRFPGVTGPIIDRVAVKRDWSAQRLVRAAEGDEPATARVLEGVKEATKSLLGARVYDRFRSAVLTIRR